MKPWTWQEQLARFVVGALIFTFAMIVIFGAAVLICKMGLVGVNSSLDIISFGIFCVIAYGVTNMVDPLAFGFDKYLLKRRGVNV